MIMTNQEIITNAIQWFINHDIPCHQDDWSSVYINVNDFEIQVSNAEVEYRSELWMEQFETEKE